MERLKTITIIFLLAIGLLVPAALAKHPSVLLREGLYAEETEGDLDAAIKVYERIIINFPRNRPVAAKALLHIGLCYEKLGKQEAQKAYRRLIKEFADQHEPVQTARRHLEQLDAGAPGAKANGPTYRLALDSKIAGMPVNVKGRDRRFLDFSPSGDRIVFVSQRKLYIADETGTLIRPILYNFAPWNRFAWPRWSPDGRQIAYVASRHVTSDSGVDVVNTIFVLSPDGRAPRKIIPERKGYAAFGWLRWTYDGKHLTYLGQDGVHTVALDGSEVRFIPSKDLPGKYNNRLSDGEYSPNGRWLAYGGRSEEGAMDVWILPAAGGQAQALRHSLGILEYPTWFPDGRTLYFVSRTFDTENIWKVAIDPETGLQKGESQQVTFFNDAEVTFPKALGDGSRVAFELQRSNTSIHVANGSPPYEPRTVARGPAPLMTHPYLTNFHLSGDGRTLAYIAKLNGGGGLFTLPVSGGEPQLLVKITGLGVVPQWSPDGSELSYADGNDLYVIGAASGQPRKIAHLDRGWDEWTVRWSPDGKFIAATGYSPKPGTTSNAVFVAPASGGELRQLTPFDDHDNLQGGVEWHPDGRRLSYNVMHNLNRETHQVYLDGRPPSLLFDTDLWDYVGAWAPDGRRFFFMSHDVMMHSPGKKGWGLFVYDEASGDITLFADHVASQSPPHWSRDGKTMAWWATRQTERQAWIMENFLPESTTSK